MVRERTCGPATEVPKVYFTAILWLGVGVGVGDKEIREFHPCSESSKYKD